MLHNCLLDFPSSPYCWQASPITCVSRHSVHIYTCDSMDPTVASNQQLPQQSPDPATYTEFDYAIPVGFYELAEAHSKYVVIAKINDTNRNIPQARISLWRLLILRAYNSTVSMADFEWKLREVSDLLYACSTPSFNWGLRSYYDIFITQKLTIQFQTAGPYSHPLIFQLYWINVGTEENQFVYRAARQVPIEILQTGITVYVPETAARLTGIKLRKTTGLAILFKTNSVQTSELNF